MDGREDTGLDELYHVDIPQGVVSAIVEQSGLERSVVVDRIKDMVAQLLGDCLEEGFFVWDESKKQIVITYPDDDTDDGEIDDLIQRGSFHVARVEQAWKEAAMKKSAISLCSKN